MTQHHLKLAYNAVDKILNALLVGRAPEFYTAFDKLITDDSPTSSQLRQYFQRQALVDFNEGELPTVVSKLHMPVTPSATWEAFEYYLAMNCHILAAITDNRWLQKKAKAQYGVPTAAPAYMMPPRVLALLQNTANTH